MPVHGWSATSKPGGSIVRSDPALGTPQAFPVVITICRDCRMEQRISLITLGVADLARARGFYEALGWSVAGGSIIRHAAIAVWGGTTGAFADPDGYVWEVAHNPEWSIDPDGTVHI